MCLGLFFTVVGFVRERIEKGLEYFAERRNAGFPVPSDTGEAFSSLACIECVLSRFYDQATYMDPDVGCIVNGQGFHDALCIKMPSLSFDRKSYAKIALTHDCRFWCAGCLNQNLHVLFSTGFLH